MKINKNSNLPLYKQIYDTIIDIIEKGEIKPGESFYSEHELSRKLDVSRQTVRKSYAMLEEDGILQKVHGKGTFVAENKEKKRSEIIRNGNYEDKVIGVLFPEMTVFFPNILKGIEEKATKMGYSINIMFNDSFEKEKAAIKSLLEKNIDGVIIAPFRSFGFTSVSNYMLLLEKNIPVTMVGKPPCKIKCDAVYCDDIQGSYDAIKRVVEVGYKRVIHITSSQHDIEAVEERKAGYVMAVEEFLGKEKVQVVDMVEDDWKAKLSNLIKSYGEKTAIFLDTDNIAPLIYNFIYSLKKKIPEEVGIISVDNNSICENLPVSLSSIEHPKIILGNIAFELLYDKINSEAEDGEYKKIHHIILETKLIERDSI